MMFKRDAKASLFLLPFLDFSPLIIQKNKLFTVNWFNPTDN